METAVLNMKGIWGRPVSSNKYLGQVPDLEGRTENWGLFLIKEIIG